MPSLSDRPSRQASTARRHDFRRAVSATTESYPLRFCYRGLTRAKRESAWRLATRKLRHVGEGTLGRHGIYLPTVAWLILMPSLSSSPWIRGAPHNGLALLMRQTKSRISVLILGRPGRRDRHRQ